MRPLLSFMVLTALSACVSFSDLEVTYPDLGHPAYNVATVDSLQPTLQWKASPKATEGYDLVVYNGPETFIAYIERGEHSIIYSRNGIQKTEHTLEEPLQPDRYYLWSVRPHTENGKEEWSRYRYTGAMPVPPFVWWTSGQLFRFKTPSTATATH